MIDAPLRTARFSTLARRDSPRIVEVNAAIPPRPRAGEETVRARPRDCPLHHPACPATPCAETHYHRAGAVNLLVRVPRRRAILANSARVAPPRRVRAPPRIVTVARDRSHP